MKWRSLEESTPGTDTRSLQDILSERKALIAKYVPPDIQGVHTRVIGELKEARFAKNVLQIGSKAPVLELKDHNGTPLLSTELLEKGRLVICFFRGRTNTSCAFPCSAMRGTKSRDSSGWSIACPTTSRPFTGAPLSICLLPMATTVGNCPSRGPSSSTAMARFFVHMPTKTIPSDRSLRKFCGN